jgi:isoquinoline 1-oxidoreductase beta subunit
MLVGAAAAAWKVPAKGITVERGSLKHDKSGKVATFGQMAEAAMKQAVPAVDKLVLKDPKDFKLIGRRLPRLDTPAKLVGEAQYAIDVMRPNMVTALVLRPPRFGATPGDIDTSEAEKVPGFVKAATVSSGVAVYAESFWQAKVARSKLKVTWDETNAEKRGTREIIAGFEAKLDAAGKSAEKRGDPDARIATPQDGDRVFKSDYVFPYLAHAPMEPLDAVIERTADGGVEAWYGCQFPGADHPTIASVLKTPVIYKHNIQLIGDIPDF